jgi:hypothetical protein
MRLGRDAANPIQLDQAPAHRFGSVPPPPVLMRSLVDIVPGLYDNDTTPDCTAVALANVARCIAYLNGYDLLVDPTTPRAFYGQCVGNPPNLVATNGAVAVEVLQLQARSGFNIGNQSLVGNWGTIRRLRRVFLADAMNRLGPTYLGVYLREREMETTGTWDLQDGRDDGAVVGGHMIPGWCYNGLADDSLVWIGTWGRWQAVTWAWLESQLEEAHTVAYRQLARSDGFYLGITADGLILDS